MKKTDKWPSLNYTEQTLLGLLFVERTLGLVLEDLYVCMCFFPSGCVTFSKLLTH